MNDDLSKSKFSINLELIFFIYDGSTLLIGSENMTKKEFSLHSTSVSQADAGLYRSTLNDDEIDKSSHSSNDRLSVEDELFYSSSLTTQCSSDSYWDKEAGNLCNLSKITQSKKVENCIGFVNSLNETQKNIDKLLQAFNPIMDISDSSIQLFPKMLSEDLLKNLESVVSHFFCSKQSIQYKDQFVFFIRIYLNNEKLINLVDEYIDTSQDEKKHEILNKLKKIELAFFQTQNLRLTIFANFVKNIEDQSELLNDYRLHIGTSLDRSFRDNLFQCLCDFQKDRKQRVNDNVSTINDQPIKNQSSVLAEEGKPTEQEIVETNYLPMDKKNHVENKETDYLPMGYSKTSSDSENLIPQEKVKSEEKRNGFFYTSKEQSTTACDLSVQLQK